MTSSSSSSAGLTATSLFCCGDNEFGQLGLGDNNRRHTFTAVPPLPDGKVAKQVVASYCHTMILAEDGTVFACGENEIGQLGLGDNNRRHTFTAVPPLPDGKVAKQVVAGSGHTMILAEDGTVFACGENGIGQLGLGDIEDRHTFTAVPPLPDGKVAKQVVAGIDYTMILAEDGTVFACGYNRNGQLGLGNNDDRDTFTAVPPLPDGKVPKQVVPGSDHTMILAEDGTVFACGDNESGQLGLGDDDEQNTFTAVPPLPDGKVPKQVVVGYHHTMILAEDGTVFACGYNRNGQLGLGDIEDRHTFTAVPPLPDGKVAKQVVAGYRHTMILAEDGTVFACGGNESGQLGLGDTANRDTFTAVPFFGPDHPDLIPCCSCVAKHTFAVPCDDDLDDAIVQTSLQKDLVALMVDNHQVVDGDVTLIGSDGVSVEAHRALLYARCPILVQLQKQQQQQQQASSSSYSQHQRKSHSAIDTASLGGSDGTNSFNDNEVSSSLSITVGNMPGRVLGALVHFLYSDTLPPFDDESKRSGSTASSSTTTTSTTNRSVGDTSCSVASLPCYLIDAFELMIAAQYFSSSDSAPAMQRLQALCEQFIAKRLNISNVVSLLRKAVEANYAPLQQACHELLAKMKPVNTDPTFGMKLAKALDGNLKATGIAISAAGGFAPPVTPASAPTEMPPSQLCDDMLRLWRRAEAASHGNMQQASASKNKKTNKSKVSKKRSRSDVGMEDGNDDASSSFGPDVRVSIGSGEDATSFMADRFILTARSEYFRACLGCGESSFREGAAKSVTLNVPPPLPSARALKAVLEYLYTGMLSQTGRRTITGSSSRRRRSSDRGDRISSSISADGSLSVEDALDVLHVMGRSDDGDGYLQLRDNKRLRSQVRDVIAASLQDANAFALLRRCMKMGQEELRSTIHSHLMQPGGCKARPTDEQEQDEDGAWMPSEAWWSKDDEIAMCHEVIGVLMD